jgi:hypothetical protein
MRITGKDVGRLRTAKKYWFRADGVSFEFFSEEFSHFLITDMPISPSERLVLTLYLSAFLNRGGIRKVHSRLIKLANGKTALLEIHDKFVAAPNGNHANKREMSLAIVGPGHIFGLFAPVPADRTEADTRRILTRILGTMIFGDSDHSVDRLNGT